MVRLLDNPFNAARQPDQAKLKIWRDAGLILSYKCNAACEFCYYRCSPDKGGLMPVDMAVDIWKSVKKMAAVDGSVHISGGEPFLVWPTVGQIIIKAAQEGLGPLDQLETNGFWAENDTIVAERLHFLNEYKLKKLKISWDPFHARFVKIDNIRRLQRIAREILGEQRVLVRWQEYLDNPPDIQADHAQIENQWRESFKKYPFRFTGRAGDKLGQIFADKNIDEIAGENCANAFLAAKGVHIDPYGNVFSGVCSGIVIGNVREKPLERLWIEFQPDKNEFICELYQNGPVGILDKAVKLGYEKRRFYAGKCHLCTELRQFFFDSGQCKRIIAPAECYRN